MGSGRAERKTAANEAGGMGGGEEALPVFLFPSSLSFALSDPATHKQVLTLYNPYEFPIQYQVLSTAPRKYSVVDPAGVLRPKCCVDIVIRHLAAGRSALGQTDRFRVQIQERGNRGVGGRKDVPALLTPTPSPANLELPPFQGTTSSDEGRGSGRSQYAFPPSEIRSGANKSDVGGGVGILSVFGGLVCVVTLSLPSQGEDSGLPSYLEMTLPQKLVAAYVLGLITMLLIRR